MPPRPPKARMISEYAYTPRRKAVYRLNRRETMVLATNRAFFNAIAAGILVAAMDIQIRREIDGIRSKKNPPNILLIEDFNQVLTVL
jgi:hypothetical protein